jgi:hydroxymethylbilane synthase
MNRIRIASRASRLALAQTNIVKKSLENLSDRLEITIVTVSTKGDRDKSDFLYKAQGVGFFTSEVEKAILDGRADLAVHSLKDLPVAATPRLVIAAVPKRESPADALVTSGQVTSIADLPAGATVGTSSPRRIAQLRHLRDDLKLVPLRGNVETRVGKVATGRLNAIIVAHAGLIRLGLAAKASVILQPEEFVTAPGQGALAVHVRPEDTELIELLLQLNDEPSRIATQAERSVLAAMRGGCSIPLGVYAKITDSHLRIDAVIADINGKNLIRRSTSSPVTQWKEAANKLAEELLQAGAKEIIDQIKNNQLKT